MASILGKERNNKDHIDRKVEDILGSLEGLRRADPGPFFHTRLMARMENARVTPYDRFVNVISRPAFAILAALLFLLLNGYFLMGMLNSGKEAGKEDFGQSLAVEYTNPAGSASFYDNNPYNP